MSQDERLRIWIEQGNVTISQLFFQNYKELGIQDVDAMLILQMIAFKADGIEFPTPTDLTKRMHLTENEVSMILQRLMQKGFLKIGQSSDQEGVLFETFNLLPLWNQLLDRLENQSKQVDLKEQQLSEGEIFQLFEQEFGRLLSPMESESISMWLDEDGHSVEIIRAALKEAVLAQKISLRYIDRILFEWKKKKVKTLQDVERHTKTYRSHTTLPVQQVNSETDQKVPFFNWLEERD